MAEVIQKRAPWPPLHPESPELQHRAEVAELEEAARALAAEVARLRRPVTTVSHEARFTTEHQPPGMDRHTNEFRLVVTVGGPVVGGILIRFEDLRAAVANLVRCIEAVPPTETLPEGSSVEQMAAWIWGRLVPGLPGLVEVQLWDGDFAVTHRGER